MSDTSRRNFLAVAGAGAGAVAVAGVTGGAAVAGTVRSAGAATEPVVAYVENPHASVVHLMVGDREVTVDDKELATRIVNAAGGN
jgi:hypothetical protein